MVERLAANHELVRTLELKAISDLTFDEPGLTVVRMARGSCFSPPIYLHLLTDDSFMPKKKKK